MISTIAEGVRGSHQYVNMIQLSLIRGMHKNPLRSFSKYTGPTGFSGLSGSDSGYISCIQEHVFLGKKKISGHDYEAQGIVKTIDID